MAKTKLGASLRAKAKAALTKPPAPTPTATQPRPPTRRPKPTAIADTAFAPLPKRTGAISTKTMDKYLSKLDKLKARNDHRVAQNAQDHLLRGFQAAHLAAQRVANPGLPFAYFPGLADLPLPRAPP